MCGGPKALIYIILKIATKYAIHLWVLKKGTGIYDTLCYNNNGISDKCEKCTGNFWVLN